MLKNFRANVLKQGQGMRGRANLVPRSHSVTGNVRSGYETRAAPHLPTQGYIEYPPPPGL